MNCVSGQHKFLCIDMYVAHIAPILPMRRLVCASGRRLASCVKNLSQISFKWRIIYYTNIGSSWMKSRDAVPIQTPPTHSQHSMHKHRQNRLMHKHGRILYNFFFFSSYSGFYTWGTVRFLSCSGYCFLLVLFWFAASDE